MPSRRTSRKLLINYKSCERVRRQGRCRPLRKTLKETHDLVEKMQGLRSCKRIYQASPRPYQGLPDIDYPFHDRTIVVTHGGRICLGREKSILARCLPGP